MSEQVHEVTEVAASKLSFLKKIPAKNIAVASAVAAVTSAVVALAVTRLRTEETVEVIVEPSPEV